jgi:hypothetical protein
MSHFTEELLIDFRELEGAHSGSNMSEVVWETLKRYNIEHRLMAVMTDNASNNDTLVDGLVKLALQDERRICLNAQWIRLRCMPHTVHLAALKVCLASVRELDRLMNVNVTLYIQLLEGVGAISTAEGKKARSRSGNYQDAILDPLKPSPEVDSDNVGRYDEDGVDDNPNTILSAVEKASGIFRLYLPLIFLCSFEGLSVQYDQAHSAKKLGSIK